VSKKVGTKGGVTKPRISTTKGTSGGPSGPPTTPKGLSNAGSPSGSIVRPIDLVGFRRDHILNRHKAGAGKEGKTEFPSDWSDDKIIDEVNKIANDPHAPRGLGKWNSPYKTGMVDGIKIRVDFYPIGHKYGGMVSTAYPTNN
jgi:hypothetical protein